MYLTTDAIYRNKFLKVNATQYTSINTHSYKVVMYIQKLHHFCNPSSPDGWAESTWEIINFARFIN